MQWLSQQFNEAFDARQKQLNKADQFQQEVVTGERFEFGKNWRVFLESLDEWQIEKAEQSLKNVLKLDDLTGRTFLDAGCGSGLFSLAAKRLGAKVVSFDYDPNCVNCAAFLKNKHFADHTDWTIMQGSVLDEAFLASLGQFDIVYSWGVLHHTGQMWKAIDNAAKRIKPNGFLFISIYNYQPFLSKYWIAVKKCYNKLGATGKKIMEWGYISYFVTALFVADALRLRNPFARYQKTCSRGMTLRRDVVDWVGGWPFEVAKPEEIFDFLHNKGFELKFLKTCAGNHGCNEYLFKANKQQCN